MRSVNFTVSEKNVNTEYTYKCDGDKLTIITNNPPAGDGDTVSKTETIILPMASTHADVTVHREKKVAKVLFGIFWLLVGIVGIVASFLPDMLCRGPLRRFEPIWFELCVAIGGFIILCGIIILIQGIMRAKKTVTTNIVITNKGQEIQNVEFLDNKKADIANAVIKFFRP